jgi:hypothetical protein
MTRGLLVWLLIMLVETIHGVLRGLLLVPHFGEAAAGRMGWPIGAVLVLAVSFACIRWTRLHATADLLGLGAMWAVLTFLFEIAIGAMRGLSASRILAEINPFEGGLMIYSVVLMFFAPLLADRLRKLGKPPQT